MKENNTIKTVKKVAAFATGVGAAAIVGTAIKTLCPSAKLGSVMKACVGLGTLAFGGIACEKTGEYIEKQIDEAADFAESIMVEVSVDEDPEVEVVEG